jgi:Cupin domain
VVVFFVLEGSMRVACGSEQWDALPGSFVFLPRGVPHAFVVTSPQPVIGLQLTSPAGFEDFIAEVGTLAGDGLPAPRRPMSNAWRLRPCATPTRSSGHPWTSRRTRTQPRRLQGQELSGDAAPGGDRRDRAEVEVPLMVDRDHG